jgi:hypothetical protein
MILVVSLGDLGLVGCCFKEGGPEPFFTNGNSSSIGLGREGILGNLGLISSSSPFIYFL